MKSTVQSWLYLAQQDLEAANRLLSDPPMPSLVAVHLQQCAEKLLKALLESAAARVPKSHDLVWLWQLCQENIELSFELDVTSLEGLSTVYMDARYPSGQGVMPMGQPSLPEVLALRQFVEEFNKRVRNLLVTQEPR